MANLITNPAFTDSNADGTADNWRLVKTVSGNPTLSIVDGLFGMNAQRVAYTSASDSAKYIQVESDLTAVGTVAAGDRLSGGIWFNFAAGAGIEVRHYVYFCNAAGSILTAQYGALMDPLPGQWALLRTCGTAPATTSRVLTAFRVVSIDTGDTVTLDVCAPYLSPDANFGYYGKYPILRGVAL